MGLHKFRRDGTHWLSGKPGKPKARHMKPQITVTILAQIVDSDLVPVNARGREYGKGWESNTEWVKRRMSAEKFCSDDIARGGRRVVYNGKEVVRCREHGAMRLH